MNSDFRDLLRAFNEEQVRYLVVGGQAFAIHAEPRYTKDLDVWIEATAENAQRAFRALARFGAPLRELKPDDFAEAGMFYQIGVPPARVDVMTELKPLMFADAWENRRELNLGDLPVNVISREDLIKNKKAVGRRQDREDVRQLRKAGQIRKALGLE